MQKTFYFRTATLFLLVLLLMGASTPAPGQDNSSAFIRPLAITKDKLKPAQQDKSSRLEKWDKVKQFQYVQLGSLPQLQKKGVLMFSIPGVAGTFTARGKRIEAKSEKDYHWYGEFTDRYGALTIHAKNGQLSGQITTEDQVYEIHALGEDVYALITVDLSKFTPSECAALPNGPATTPAPGSGRKGDPNARFVGCPPGPTRVLVLWTPAALNAMGWDGLNARIDFVLGQTNDAFRGSAIGVTIQEAGRQEINFQENQFFIREDVLALAARADLQALRNQTLADLVVLMTDGNYTDPNTWGRIFGVVPAIGPNDANAYAIVEAQEATTSYTFSHELGHLFGARHQQCGIFTATGCDNTAGDAHGFAFRTGWLNQQKWYTIMHQIRDNWSPRLYFSNPQVKVQNTTIGTWEGNNNARQIRDANGTVVNFRPTAQRLTASIEGPGYLPLYQPGNWEAIYSCGAGPYSFEWSFSSDGYNYVYGDSREITGGALYNCNEYLYLRLVVRSGDGQVAEAYHTVFTDYCNGTAYRVTYSGEENAFAPQGITLKNAYPNPFAKSTRIEFYLPESQEAKLEVLDLAGRPVKVLANGRYEAGWHGNEFYSDDLKGGLYFYRLKTGTITETKRLVLIK